MVVAPTAVGGAIGIRRVANDCKCLCRSPLKACFRRFAIAANFIKALEIIKTLLGALRHGI
jgi:hypothetical protein